MASGADVVERCRKLARISDEEGRLTRPFASVAMARANSLVGAWMTAAGATVRTDEAGNLVGSWIGADPRAGTLLLGSHLDTVRDAGAFDGPLGVVVAIAAVQRLRSEGVHLPFGVDVFGFSDEEGLRFGTAYLGSGAVAGALQPGVMELRDTTGVRVSDALHAFGGDPENIARASRKGDNLLGYLEVHMEQGPVLEELGRPVGVVSGISGATRIGVTFRGLAGHAGTVPMAMRHDALAAAAEWVLAVERAARERDGLLATVGRLETLPGAPNVVPGEVRATLDVRHADDAQRERAVAVLAERGREIAKDRGVTVGFETLLVTPAVAVSDRLTASLSAAVGAQGIEPAALPSGAGHDGVMLSRITGIAMLFVRCAGGLSHHPDESVDPADAAVAVDVVCDVLRGLAAA